LASLLWRLRRATTIETGLFGIQAEHLSDFRKKHQISPTSREIVYTLFNANSDRQTAPYGILNAIGTRSASELTSVQGQVVPDVELARCFLRLCNLTNDGLTASVAMKLPFGAKLGRFCLRSTIWIVVSHRRVSVASVLAVNKHHQASGAKSVEGCTADDHAN